MGEDGGLNMFGMVGNDTVNRLDAFGLHPLERMLYPGGLDYLHQPLPTPPTLPRNEDFDPMLHFDEGGYEKRAPIFSASTGYANYLNELRKVIPLISRFYYGDRNSRPLYRQYVRAIRIPKSPVNAEMNLHHELIHAYRDLISDKNMSWRLKREEGVGYCSGVYYNGIKQAAQMELDINKVNEKTARMTLTATWKLMWNQLNCPAFTKEVWLLGELPLTDDDWEEFTKTFKVNVSCAKLSASYNEQLKERGISCRLTCSEVPTGKQEDILITNRLPRHVE